MRHIGLFGGTFNPVHQGHLLAAQAVLETLQLDEVRFLPAAQSPLKQKPELPDHHRVAMLQRALAPYKKFVLDTRELSRPGPSYTIETLRELRLEKAEDRLYLLLGMDTWSTIEQWRDWQQIPDYCHLAVMTRPGYSPNSLSEYWQPRLASELDDLRRTPRGRLVFVAIPPSKAASSTIRNQLEQGIPVRSDYLPDTVLDYIRTQRLYRAER